jgi:putative ABC transport system permease protein
VLLSEAAILGAAGSVLGVAAATLAVVPFETLIAEKLSMPFVSSGIGSTVLIAAVVVVAGTAASLGAALNGALRLSRVEPYGDVK